MKVVVEERDNGYDVIIGEDVFHISKVMVEETSMRMLIGMVVNRTITTIAVSYTHLRAHET